MHLPPLTHTFLHLYSLSFICTDFPSFVLTSLHLYSLTFTLVPHMWASMTFLPSIGLRLSLYHQIFLAPKWRLYTWKKGELLWLLLLISLLSSWLFCVALETPVQARCLLAAALYRTVTTCRISLHNPKSSKKAAKWEPFVRTHRKNFSPQGLLKSFTPSVRWPRNESQTSKAFCSGVNRRFLRTHSFVPIKERVRIKN